MTQEFIGLRPATEADKEFARRVYIATTRPYVDHLREWTDDYIAARFERRFIVASTWMLEKDGVTVGWKRVSETADVTVLEQLYVDPAWQRRKVGSTIVGGLVWESQCTGKPISLRTLRRNPARRLYERFGFRIVDDSEPNSYGMRFVPAPTQA